MVNRTVPGVHFAPKPVVYQGGKTGHLALGRIILYCSEGTIGHISQNSHYWVIPEGPIGCPEPRGRLAPGIPGSGAALDGFIPGQDLGSILLGPRGSKSGIFRVWRVSFLGFSESAFSPIPCQRASEWQLFVAWPRL